MVVLGSFSDWSASHCECCAKAAKNNTSKLLVMVLPRVPGDLEVALLTIAAPGSGESRSVNLALNDIVNGPAVVIGVKFKRQFAGGCIVGRVLDLEIFRARIDGPFHISPVPFELQFDANPALIGTSVTCPRA